MRGSIASAVVNWTFYNNLHGNIDIFTQYANHAGVNFQFHPASQIPGNKRRCVGAESVAQMHRHTLLLLIDGLEKTNRNSCSVAVFLPQVIFTSKGDLLVKYSTSQCRGEGDV